MLKPWTRYILYLFTTPIDLFGWALMIFVGLVWGPGWPRWVDGVLIATVRNSSWPGRTWYKRWGGTTFGHAIMIREGQEGVLEHELVHVRQFEVISLLAFLVFCAQCVRFPIWTALITWIAIPIAHYSAAVFVALMQGRDGYRNNVLEEAAYDRAEVEKESKP